MISDIALRVRTELADRERSGETEEQADHVSSSLTEKPVWGSAGAGTDIKHFALFRPGRALVNPFDPSNVPFKQSSNRRRWTHIFPKVSGCYDSCLMTEFMTFADSKLRPDATWESGGHCGNSAQSGLYWEWTNLQRGLSAAGEQSQEDLGLHGGDES